MAPSPPYLHGKVPNLILIVLSSRGSERKKRPPWRDSTVLYPTLNLPNQHKWFSFAWKGSIILLPFLTLSFIFVSSHVSRNRLSSILSIQTRNKRFKRQIFTRSHKVCFLKSLRLLQRLWSQKQGPYPASLCNSMCFQTKTQCGRRL